MRLSDPRVRSTILINLASILEKCDEQILPAVRARGPAGALGRLRTSPMWKRAIAAGL